MNSSDSSGMNPDDIPWKVISEHVETLCFYLLVCVELLPKGGRVSRIRRSLISEHRTLR
jgi:hypothetical protein